MLSFLKSNKLAKDFLTEDKKDLLPDIIKYNIDIASDWNRLNKITLEKSDVDILKKLKLLVYTPSTIFKGYNDDSLTINDFQLGKNKLYVRLPQIFVIYDPLLERLFIVDTQNSKYIQRAVEITHPVKKAVSALTSR